MAMPKWFHPTRAHEVLRLATGVIWGKIVIAVRSLKNICAGVLNSHCFPKMETFSETQSKSGIIILISFSFTTMLLRTTFKSCDPVLRKVSIKCCTRKAINIGQVLRTLPSFEKWLGIRRKPINKGTGVIRLNTAVYHCIVSIK